MEAIEIKLDASTLPKDHQDVMWQTYSDINNREWKEGLFVKDGEGLFLYNENLKDGSFESYDMAFDVFQWKPILTPKADNDE